MVKGHLTCDCMITSCILIDYLVSPIQFWLPFSFLFFIKHFTSISRSPPPPYLHGPPSWVVLGCVGLCWVVLGCVGLFIGHWVCYILAHVSPASNCSLTPTLAGSCHHGLHCTATETVEDTVITYLELQHKQIQHKSMLP